MSPAGWIGYMSTGSCGVLVRPGIQARGVSLTSEDGYNGLPGNQAVSGCGVNLEFKLKDFSIIVSFFFSYLIGSH